MYICIENTFESNFYHTFKIFIYFPLWQEKTTYKLLKFIFSRQAFGPHLNSLKCAGVERQLSGQTNNNKVKY